MLLKLKILEGETLVSVNTEGFKRYSNVFKTYYYVNEYITPNNTKQLLWAYNNMITVYHDQLILLLEELKTDNVAWQLSFPSSKAQTADNFKLIHLVIYKILFNGQIYYIQKDDSKLEIVT